MCLWQETDKGIEGVQKNVSSLKLLFDSGTLFYHCYGSWGHQFTDVIVAFLAEGLLHCLPATIYNLQLTYKFLGNQWNQFSFFFLSESCK